ncbi:MAG: RNA polymerase sigma-70 factor [Cytophagales bacterium]|nr:RNA polymerase sigma-70 factor [Cytophagales bacterium]
MLDENKSLVTHEGFERIYRKYIKKLCRIAFNQVKDETVVQNIVHNVFCSLWESRHNLHLEGPVEHYLVRAVKLAAFDYIRTKLNREKNLESALSGYNGSKHCTEEQVRFNELSEKINTLVDRLPRQCRQVYRLSREKGMSNREIASILSLAEKTVEAHLSKALKFLRVNLADYRH